eukprot:TRINITY_DN14575_c0_g1_i1.p1 TRINITY_DN14575_c0_g1~~TRINITY_DN14575_c0_g1_i1.p1  ORF type:complete len:108 (+),score=32.30 TRINITY_DN14575_c0_g1_i1:151-474(+)
MTSMETTISCARCSELHSSMSSLQLRLTELETEHAAHMERLCDGLEKQHAAERLQLQRENASLRAQLQAALSKAQQAEAEADYATQKMQHMQQYALKLSYRLKKVQK